MNASCMLLVYVGPREELDILLLRILFHSRFADEFVSFNFFSVCHDFFFTFFNDFLLV